MISRLSDGTSLSWMTAKMYLIESRWLIFNRRLIVISYTRSLGGILLRFMPSVFPKIFLLWTKLRQSVWLTVFVSYASLFSWFLFPISVRCPCTSLACPCTSRDQFTFFLFFIDILATSLLFYFIIIFIFFLWQTWGWPCTPHFPLFFPFFNFSSRWRYCRSRLISRTNEGVRWCYNLKNCQKTIILMIVGWNIKK